MHGDRIKETSTTGGTGNLTLAGAETGFRTVNSEFSNDTTDAGIPFAYTIYENSGADYEEGYGHLSASTTFVRDSVIRSSNSDAAVNFDTDVTVIASPIADSVGVNVPMIPAATADDRIVAPQWYQMDAASSRSINTVYYQQFYWPGGKCDALCARVTTALASSTITMGIYTWSPTTGKPDKQLQAGAGVSGATTGMKFSTFTARTLPAGYYYLALVHDTGSISYRVPNGSARRDTLMGFNADFAAEYNRFTESSSTLPATATPGNPETGSAPIIGLRMTT
jgi:hypothetical protein